MSSKTGRKIKVMLADDHLVVRMGLSALISLEPGMTVAGEAEDGESALEFGAATIPMSSSWTS